MNRFPTRLILACVTLIVTVCGVHQSGEAGSVRKIGIFAFSREMRYEDARKGIIDQLRQDGYAEPVTLFVYENADANKAKAAEIVRKMQSEKFDLIFTLGTNMTIPVAREIKDVPIVFSSVYDPIASGIAQSWESSGNNTTGTTSHVPMGRLVDVLVQFRPVKNLHVLYAPNEKNSEVQLRELQTTEKMQHVRIVPVPVSSTEEIGRVLPVITKTADAIFLTGSNLIGGEAFTIASIATKAGVITITHLPDLVEQGVLLGFTYDPYETARVAGAKAVRILKGAKPSSIPIETSHYAVLLNKKTAQSGKFAVAPEFLKKVTRIIE